MKEGKELLFEVGGVEIYRGSIYVVKHKEDLGAPSGFIDKGVTKLPSSGVDETFQCVWRKTSETTGVWDTGFHEYSPCYRGENKSVVKEKIELLHKNLVEPFERAIGKQGILSHSNDHFWDKRMFKVFPDQVFNTEEPEDLLVLYFGLLNRELTPKGQEGNTLYNESPFVLLDKTKDIKKKDEKASNLFEAIGVVEILLKTDRVRLMSILNYLNIILADSNSDASVRGIMKEYFEQKSGSNVDLFMMTYNDSETEEGRAKIEIFVKLKEALRRGNKVTKNPNGVLFYGDTEIGPGLKEAALNIAKTKDLAEIKNELLFEEEVTDGDK